MPEMLLPSPARLPATRPCALLRRGVAEAMSWSRPEIRLPNRVRTLPALSSLTTTPSPYTGIPRQLWL